MGLRSKRSSNPKGAHRQTDRSISDSSSSNHQGNARMEAKLSEDLVPQAYQAVKRLVATRDISRSSCSESSTDLRLLTICETLRQSFEGGQV